MYTSISPMVFGFNNPMKFNDPTGLFGDNCDDCPVVDLSEVTVTATRLTGIESDYSMLLAKLRNSGNPVYRNLGDAAHRSGYREAYYLMNRGRMLHYSDYEAQQSKNSEYLDGIRAMYKYGISGSMIAAAASPVLIEGLKNGITTNIGREAISQIGVNLALNGDVSNVDIGDVALSAAGKYSFFLKAAFDINMNGDVRNVFQDKHVGSFLLDLSIGGFNSYHRSLMIDGAITNSIINAIDVFNGNIRVGVSELSKTGWE